MADLPAMAIAAAAYFVAGKLGLRLAFLHVSASAVWPPTGIALAAFLLAGNRLWPAIFAGAFMVNITTAGSVATALGIATGNTLEGLVGAWLARRFANGSRAFERPQDIIRFWFLAGMAASSVSATLGVATLCLTGFAQWTLAAPIWLTWWLGDAVGGFVMASIIILWSSHERLEWTRAQALEALLILSCLTIMGLIVFTGTFSYEYSCLPILLWVAFRFGQREVSIAVLVLASIAVWGTLRGSGPFVAESKNGSLVLMQAFVGVAAVTSMAIAAVVSERRRAGDALRSAHDELERRVKERTEELSGANQALRTEITERERAEGRFRRLLESAPDAMIIVNNRGEIVLVNSQAEQMFGHDRAEMIGRPVEMLIPGDDRGGHVGNRAGYFASPRTRPMGLGIDLRGLRKDGSEFPVEIALSPIETEEGTVVCAAVRDTTEQKRLEQEVTVAARQRSQDLREFAISVQGAQEEERRRIARELHDELGQRLTGLKLGLQVLEADLPPDNRKAGARLHRLMRELDRMIQEVRRLSYNLRPAALDDFGLVVALQMLCKEFEKVYKVKTRFHASEALAAFHDPQLDIALYRVAQESLANTARHATATTASVRLFGGHNAVVLSVEDDGRGFDLEAFHARKSKHRNLGLVGMRERSELLGGSFQVESSPDHGTRIQVQLPLPTYRIDEANSNTNRG
jgi:PAS domain S-box-containing protein